MLQRRDPRATTGTRTGARSGAHERVSTWPGRSRERTRSPGHFIQSLARQATRTGDLSPFAAPALAVLFVGGGALTLLLTALPGPAAPVVSSVVGLAATTIGIVLARRTACPPVWALNALVGTATLLVAIVIADTGETGRPEALAFVWIGLYCGVFFSRRAQIAQLALITVAFTTAIVVRDSDGQTTTAMVRHTIMVVGAIAVGLAWIGLLRRLTESLISQQTSLVRTDSLTSLPNRAELRRRGRPLLARSGRATMLLVDLDDFKLVNDRWGHDRGDRVLRTVARRLVDACDDDDLITRLGGDEFAILLAGDDRAESTARAIAAAMETPIPIGDDDVQVDVSIGVATAHEHEDIDELLSDADLAMHTAKASGQMWHAFEPNMRADAHAQHEVFNDLRHALADEQFSLRYQPIVALNTQRTKAVEALVRWEHPERGLIGPDRFIPVAESTGLVIPLGRWVLDRACDVAARWPGAAPPRVTVNLSPRQLLDGRVVHDVAEVLERVSLPPERLVLEITETSVMSEPELAIRQLHELVGLGVSLAIDDFGTGYSSLEYLRQLPVRTVKLARTFILDLTESEQSAAFAAGVIDLSHVLGKVVVAEGIEEDEQRRVLTEIGCDLAQGYLFDRPLFEGDIQRRLERESSGLALNAAGT